MIIITKNTIEYLEILPIYFHLMELIERTEEEAVQYDFYKNKLLYIWHCSSEKEKIFLTKITLP